MTINDRINKLCFDCILLRHKLEAELTKKQADAEVLEDAAYTKLSAAGAADEDMNVPLEDVNRLYDEYEEANRKAKDSRKEADYVENLIDKIKSLEDAILL